MDLKVQEAATSQAIKICPEAESNKETLSSLDCPEENRLTLTHLGLQIPCSVGDKFVLLQGTRFVIICYNNHRNLAQIVHQYVIIQEGLLNGLLGENTASDGKALPPLAMWKWVLEHEPPGELPFALMQQAVLSELSLGHLPGGTCHCAV